MSLSALQIYYYPSHWIQCLPAHTACTISPSGSIPAMRYLTLKNCLTINDGRILPSPSLPGVTLEVNRRL